MRFIFFAFLLIIFLLGCRVVERKHSTGILYPFIESNIVEKFEAKSFTRTSSDLGMFYPTFLVKEHQLKNRVISFKGRYSLYWADTLNEKSYSIFLLKKQKGIYSIVDTLCFNKSEFEFRYRTFNKKKLFMMIYRPDILKHPVYNFDYFIKFYLKNDVEFFNKANP